MKAHNIVAWLLFGSLAAAVAQTPQLAEQIRTLWAEKKFYDLQSLADARLGANRDDVVGLAISLDVWPVTGTNYADLLSLHARLEAHSRSQTNEIFQSWYGVFGPLHTNLVAVFGSTDTNRQAALRAFVENAVEGPPPCWALADRLGL